MGIRDLPIKLDEAKQAIAIPDFNCDDLLRVALVHLCTLQPPVILEQDRKVIERQHRRLAFLGDRLLEAILADYLFATHPELTKRDLDRWRKKINCRESLTAFAIKLGLPDFCSSWDRATRKPPEVEQGVYGEMFEALVAVIYLDSDRNFRKVYEWLCNRFIREAVEFAEEFDTTLTTREYLDMIGLA